MLEITEREIRERLAFDNPWWENGEEIDSVTADYPQRLYFRPFRSLVADSAVRRAVILLGPRRVGKTVMVYQTVQSLLEQGVPGRSILYLSLETPLYTGLSLERLLRMFRDLFSHGRNETLYVFFDEIQYLKDWEIHLKSLVDSYPAYRFVATGSAAAALRLKSRESGAGRFTEFLLPPLSFVEYLRFTKQEEELITHTPGDAPDRFRFSTNDIARLNDIFIDYLNFGGYPEAVFVEAVRNESARFIKGDIIDKVLLRDLPSLYGIADIQELNRLFTVLAYNTGNEVSYEGLTKSSGVAKNTIKRYLEYLEAAFLIRPLHCLDQNARRLQRVSRFKVYLTNPSMRAALFGPVNEASDAVGALIETAIVDQWSHNAGSDELFYARWKEGEVDLVNLGRLQQKPVWGMEIKWSDRPFHDRRLLGNLVGFLKKHSLDRGTITTRSVQENIEIDGITIRFVPNSLQAYTVGRNLLTQIAGGTVSALPF